MMLPMASSVSCAPLRMPITPGIFSAADVSMDLILACAVRRADEMRLLHARHHHVVGILALAGDEPLVFLAHPLGRRYLPFPCLKLLRLGAGEKPMGTIGGQVCQLSRYRNSSGLSASDHCRTAHPYKPAAFRLACSGIAYSAAIRAAIAHLGRCIENGLGDIVVARAAAEYWPSSSGKTHGPFSRRGLAAHAADSCRRRDMIHSPACKSRTEVPCVLTECRLTGMQLAAGRQPPRWSGGLGTASALGGQAWCRIF